MLLLVWAFFTSAYAFELPARPQAHVNDYAHVLTAEAARGLEQRFASFEERTHHQAVVAIFASIDENPIEDVATKLFEKWRLGAKKENDGVLLVLAIQEHDIRIEVGYGLEGQLPDALAGQIIQNDMIPSLRQGQTATAILSFEKRLEEIFIDGTTPVYKTTPQRGNRSLLFWIIVLLIVILLLKGGSGPNRTINSGGVSRRKSSLPFIFWGGGGGGWGGGSGGGWGGGGGGLSGGGGASGKW